MAYEHRLKVRYGETDQMGVVHHANYLLYLEEARTELMCHLGHAYAAIEASGIGLPVRTTELRFHAPAFYGDELVVSVTVERLRAASVTFGYEVARYPGRGRLMTGTVELACVRMTAERRPCPLPDDLRGALEGIR